MIGCIVAHNIIRSDLLESFRNQIKIKLFQIDTKFKLRNLITRSCLALELKRTIFFYSMLKFVEALLLSVSILSGYCIYYELA